MAGKKKALSVKRPCASVVSVTHSATLFEATTMSIVPSALAFSAIVNETFALGEDQKIAIPPLRMWVVPDGRDPQAFKDELLAEHFTPEELAHRDEFIRTFSQLLAEELDGIFVYQLRLKSTDFACEA